jgi:4'-phosphopantetheinyl transferase
MFRHVLVLASEHPSLAQGQAPPGLLSPREEAILAGLVLLPRRRKWLLGRLAAKCLVRELLGDAVASAGISVLNRPSGQPFVLLEGQGEWPTAISLSHRGDAGLAAAPDACGGRIGADLETIVPRDAALIRQFFTACEAAQVAASGALRDEIVARIWSAKEAVLKLWGLGLRLDTRAVEVSLDVSPDDGAPCPACPQGFHPVVVTAHVPGMAGAMCVVWRRVGDFVLTVATAA